MNLVISVTETESENEFRPLDGRIDEFHPKATRTLFIGNLEKTTNYQQLLDVFQRFGEIVVRFLYEFPSSAVKNYQKHFSLKCSEWRLTKMLFCLWLIHIITYLSADRDKK